MILPICQLFISGISYESKTFELELAILRMIGIKLFIVCDEGFFMFLNKKFLMILATPEQYRINHFSSVLAAGFIQLKLPPKR